MARYVAALKQADIRVGVITNHNKFDRDEFKALRKAARKEDIYLMPGVELSVKDGRNGIHTLVVFHDEWVDNRENADHINGFLGLTFAGQTGYDNSNARSNHDLPETLRELDKFEKDYFLIFAHVEENNGLWGGFDGGRITELGQNELFRSRTAAFQKVRQNITNPESVAGDLVAFSNSKGGLILIGVDDQGTVVGLSADDIRRINQLIPSTATDRVRPSINPTTENISVGELLVMVVTVQEGISKPYADNNGVFWVKSGADKRRVASREEVQRMLQSADLMHADELPVEGTTTGDIDFEHFNGFFEKLYGEPLDKALDRDGISLGRLLNNLGLAREAMLNLAGVMIFGRNPQRHRPAFVIKAVSFVGNDPSGDKYRDSQDIEGCLRDLYKGTISFLTRNLRRLQDGKGFNTEGDLEVPPAALEELVVNMLLHRDYFISAPWRVMLFDNRIELISPGALPNNITVENIRNGVSVIRNPLIASFATKGNELPYRGIGTGIRRALAVVPALELESDHDRNLFTARIPRQGAT